MTKRIVLTKQNNAYFMTLVALLGVRGIMEKKLEVLMELRPCLHGFSGIPQETRLLFSYFLNMPHVNSTGLINSDVPNFSSLRLASPLAPKKDHQKINELSRLIISAVEPSRFTLLEKVKLALRQIGLSFETLLGLSLPMRPFETKGFEDFLWDRFFSKTLDITEFKTVTNALFQMLLFSRTTLRLAKLAHQFPKIATERYDAFVVQTPFPGRVSNNTQLIVRYHDAIPLFIPHLINQPKSHQSLHYKALCSNAKKGIFVCTSHAVKQDLLQVFPGLEARTPVIYDTISPAYYEETTSNAHLAQIIRHHSYESRRTIATTEDQDDTYYQTHLDPNHLQYIMMVSTIEPRKNHIRLIQAWERVCKKLNRDIKLLFVGDLGWQYQSIMAAMKPWQQRGQLFHLQKVPVESMRLLYQGAACIVCPSIKEGFDLSGIEGMACGGVIVASDISVHREVYGEAARYFDPYCVLQQAEAIESVLTPGNSLRHQLKATGLKQVTHYQPSAIKPQWADFFENILREKHKKKQALPA